MVSGLLLTCRDAAGAVDAHQELLNALGNPVSGLSECGIEAVAPVGPCVPLVADTPTSHDLRRVVDLLEELPSVTGVQLTSAFYDHEACDEQA